MQIQTRTTTRKKDKPAPQTTDDAAAKSKIAAKTTAKRGRRASQKRVKALISAEERHRLIAETAYSYADRRGFEGGDPVRDWLKAEAHIDSMYRLER